MPGREYTSQSVGGYRFGFNGKENDGENVGTGEGTQDYGFRIYNPTLGRFLSVDPLTKTYPWYTPYQFAGNMPINSIDLDGLEPKSVIEPKYTRTYNYSYEGGLDDYKEKPIKISFSVTTYKFTEAAAHLLSLTTGISKADIKKIEVRNAQGSGLPSYPIGRGEHERGGAITFPGENTSTYRMNFTSNFFSSDLTSKKFGRNDFSESEMSWLDLSSHEVGHIVDIKEIGGGKEKYFATFIGSYAKSSGHGNNWREKRANVGQAEFRKFKDFVDGYYGEGKLGALFENQNNSQKDIIGRLDQWYARYQKTSNEQKKTTD